MISLFYNNFFATLNIEITYLLTNYGPDFYSNNRRVQWSIYVLQSNFTHITLALTSMNSSIM